jgi:hypothetical protein
MGEYTYNYKTRQKVKVGTCECMYYSTIQQILTETNYVTPTIAKAKNYWRLPLVAEMGYTLSKSGYKFWKEMSPCIHAGDGNHTNWKYSRHTRINSERLLELLEKGNKVDNPDWLRKSKGIVQLTHPSGLLVNMPCYHGFKLPESTDDIKVHWNGHNDRMCLCSIKTVGRDCWICVGCIDCETSWAITLEELEYIMKEDKKQYGKHMEYIGTKEECINPKMVAAIKEEIRLWQTTMDNKILK